MHGINVEYTDYYLDTTLKMPDQSYSLSMEWLAFDFLFNRDRNILQEIF